jgi:pimeloyl-ACP methyl ester carboxylesterase
MWPKMKDIDFFTQARKLDVPVYFLEGRYDYNAPTEIVERYVAALDAPHKEIVWFESSGHMMNVSEPEYFQEVLIDKVLAQTQAE